MANSVAVYSPEVFRVRNAEEAKSIILTTEDGCSTDERWERETPWLMEELGSRMELRPDMTVLDFGCGIGRVAKVLIERWGCSVIGVDISPEMRALAKDYVNSERFQVFSPEALGYKMRQGLRVDGAYAIWVLQHVAVPRNDVALIHAVLKAGGKFYVLNDHRRIVPTSKGWVNDGQDIHSILSAAFDVVAEGVPPASSVPPTMYKNYFWKLIRKR